MCPYSLFRFSTTKKQWEQLDEDISGFPPGSAIDFHDMVAVDSDHDSDLYVFGNEPERMLHMNELFRFSIKELKWEKLDASRVKGSPPSSRSAHRMVSVGSDLYVFGGYTGTGDIDYCIN